MSLQLVPLREKLQIGGTNSRSPAVLEIPSTSAPRHVRSQKGPICTIPLFLAKTAARSAKKSCPNK